MNKVLLLVTLVLFLTLLPLSYMITFWQNDEWVYYPMVENFMKGDFKLHFYTAATFYLQGFLGLIFAKAFSLEKLPILTLAISTACFYVFTLIIHKFYLKNIWKSFVLGFLFFFNPLFAYSIWGFMTDNYFMLFLLVSIYFILSFNNSNQPKHFALANIAIILSYFVKQFAFITLLSFAIYLFATKKFKYGIIQLSIFIIMILFHYTVFPLTPSMYDSKPEFSNILDIKYLVNMLFAAFIYLTALLAPLFLNLIDIKCLSKKTRVVIFAVVFIGIIILVHNYFNPDTQLAWGEYPYFQNTYERKGFYPRGILGTKYHFYGIHDLYKNWELFAKSAVIISAPLIFACYYKKWLKFSTIFIILYIGLFVVTPVIYDRYLIPLFPIFILFLLDLKNISNKVSWIIVCGFTAFLMFYSTQFSLDFVLTNNYVWNRAEQLVESDNLQPNQIQVSHAWKIIYPTDYNNLKYRFTFDNPDVAPKDFSWRVIEVKEIKYPLNFFINPNIYLYERI